MRITNYGWIICGMQIAHSFGYVSCILPAEVLNWIWENEEEYMGIVPVEELFTKDGSELNAAFLSMDSRLLKKPKKL